MPEIKQFTLAEIASHNTRKSLYVAIHGKVYDVTYFIDEHPGGDEVLFEEAGRNATESFDDVGHSDEAHEILKRYYIGELKDVPTPSKAPIVSKAPTKSQSYTTPKAPQPKSSSNFGLLVPVGIFIAYIAYKYFVSSSE
ncbi:1520_t:CDS:2 [Ambispora leptoticha]|uniref:1520_t:CDS:1 n=1 Tax=Ambispora leptoticha TaxID=144679 RepID=A0A9N8ZDV5_9GLOM|nr:1520_t:CDS:2 [Ambispora leptoticha]